MMKKHDPSTTNLDDYNLDVFEEQMYEPQTRIDGHIHMYICLYVFICIR